MSKAELLLLSSMIRGQDATQPGDYGLTPDYFHAFTKEAKWVFGYVEKHRKTPSKAAFRNQFPDTRLLAADDVGLYCEEVMKSHAKHRLLVMFDEAMDEVSNGDPMKALRVVTDNATSIGLDVSLLGKTSCVVEEWEEAYEEAKRRVEASAENGIPGLPTGFGILDDRSGGYQPGHMWVWAARLGEGKTWSLVRSSVASLFEGKVVNYHALEQSRSQITLRVQTFLSSRYGKQVFRNLDLMKGKNYNLLEYKAFLEEMSHSLPGKFHVMDTQRGRVTPSTIAAAIEQNQPDIVFIDYLTLMEQNGDDWRATAKLSGDIKTLAGRYDIPVVVAAQINRGGVGKDPAGAEMLAQSDAIGQDADGLVTMKKMSEHAMKLKMAKYRHGPDGYLWWAKFMPNVGVYEECSSEDALDLIEADQEAEDEAATAGRS